MHVVITGAAGFLGRRLAERLMARGALPDAGGHDRPLECVTLVDVVAGAPPADRRVRHLTGDIADPALLRRAITADTAAVFHLAAVVSGMAEADFDLGLRVNLDATRQLLETCRERAHGARLVFTSSVAVYGGVLPAIVQDSTALTPQSSYGMEKAVAELLVCDYTRRGFVDGRVLRLPTISVRPGRPNTALSSFASGIIREPLNGDDAVCPVDRSARLWLLSPARAVDCLMHAMMLPADAFGGSRLVNLPGLSVTVGEMVDALERAAGPEAVARIRWQRDPLVARLVAGWPAACDMTRAHALGFKQDESFDAIVRDHIEEKAQSSVPSSDSQ